MASQTSLTDPAHFPSEPGWAATPCLPSPPAATMAVAGHLFRAGMNVSKCIPLHLMALCFPKYLGTVLWGLSMFNYTHTGIWSCLPPPHLSSYELSHGHYPPADEPQECLPFISPYLPPPLSSPPAPTLPCARPRAEPESCSVFFCLPVRSSLVAMASLLLLFHE